jgi:sodium-dependent phosphate transporter
MDLLSGSGSAMASPMDAVVETSALNFGQYEWIVVAGALICFVVAFGIGANDVANAFATSVGSKSLSMRQAVCIAAVCEFGGAVLLGSRVTDTVRKGITSQDLFNKDEAHLGLLMIGMLSVLMSVAAWLLIATRLEMPVSTTHSCIGGIIGMALAANGSDAVNWEKVQMVVASWFLSPLLSALLAAIMYGTVRTLILRSKDSYERTYTFYPILVGFTIFVNVFFFIYKGSPTLGFKDTMSAGTGLRIATAIGAAVALIVRFTLVGYIRNRVEERFALKDSAKTVLVKPLAAITTAETSADDVFGDRSESYIQVVSIDKAENDEGLVLEELANSTDTDADIAALKLEKLRNAASNMTHIDPEAVAKNFAKVGEIHENAEKFDEKTEGVFTYLQVVTAIFDSIAHGSNDVANAIGPMAAIWAIYETETTNDIGKKVDVPIWILALGGVGIIFGLALYGYKIITAIGVKLTKITPSRGFSIEIGSALVIIMGSFLELPLSTTHCQVGATLGVGIFEGAAAGVDWKAFGKIAFGWVFTLVFCGFMSAAFFSFAAFSPSKNEALNWGVYDLDRCGVPNLTNITM